MAGQVAMAVDRVMRVQEAAVSSETAISCLALLRSQIASDVDPEAARSRQQVGSPTLAISELIELANDFGFKAQYIHRDWPWLQLAVATQPVLLLLKNGNIIVAVGLGHTGAEEIVVSDPLHRSGALIILSRVNIERAWDGDIITIVPKSFISETLDTDRDIVIPEQVSNQAEKTQRFWKLFGVILLCLGSVAVVAALITLPFGEKPVVSQKSGPVVPAVPPLHVSTITNGMGHQHASGKAAKVGAPSVPLASTASGSIAAGAIFRPLRSSLPLAYTASGLISAGAIQRPLGATLPLAYAASGSIAAGAISHPSDASLSLAYTASGSIAAGAVSHPLGASLPLAYAASGSIAAGAISHLLDAPLPSNPKNPEAPVGALLASVPSVAQVIAKPVVVAPSASAKVPLGAVKVPAEIVVNAVMAPPAGSPPASEGSGLSGNAKLSASDIAALLARGDDQLRLGDVASARLFYQHAADAGEANGALRLGETFDPIFLTRANLHASGDLEKAVFWYYRARELGSKEADKLLKELTTNNGVGH